MAAFIRTLTWKRLGASSATEHVTHQYSHRVIIGFDEYSYNAERNIYVPSSNVVYKKARRIPVERLLRSSWPWAVFSYIPMSIGHVDLLHTWNRVNWGPRRWGATFESEFPRFFLPVDNVLTRKAFGRMASSQCRFFIGMSRWACDVSKALWETANIAGEVLPKLHQVYPAFRGGRWRLRTLSDAEPIRLVFIGGDFFRKGGDAVLDAIERVGDQLDIECAMVTRIDSTDIGARLVTTDELRRARGRLSSSSRVKWFKSLQHEHVLKLIQDSHIGILPSLNDTFGYSVVECMEAGLPVITSNISALPEFVNERVGWVLPVPLDPLRYWDGWKLPQGTPQRHERYVEAVQALSAGVAEVLQDLRDRPEQLRAKSAATKVLIESTFDPVARQNQIEDIYRQALS